MKPNALLLKTSRGSLVVEQAVANVAAFLAGTPVNVVNRQAEGCASFADASEKGTVWLSLFDLQVMARAA